MLITTNKIESLRLFGRLLETNKQKTNRQDKGIEALPKTQIIEPDGVNLRCLI